MHTQYSRSINLTTAQLHTSTQFRNMHYESTRNVREKKFHSKVKIVKGERHKKYYMGTPTIYAPQATPTHIHVSLLKEEHVGVEQLH